MDTESAGYVAGTAGSPSNSLMVYYQTNDYALLQQYDGIVITIDVVIYTYRSNNQAFAIYYVGGQNGVTATLSDEQKQTIDAAALSVPASITEATTLSEEILPTTGVNGSTISWSSSNPEVIDPTTRVVTIPNPAVVVTLSASIVAGQLAPVTRNFEVAVGALETVNLSTVETLNNGAKAYSEVKVLWKNPSTNAALLNKAFVVGDESGYAYLVNDVALPNLQVGDFIGISYEIFLFSGYLVQLTKVKFLTPSGTQPTNFPAAEVWTSTEAIQYMGSAKVGIKFITLNNLIGFKSGNFLNAYLPGLGSTRTIRTDGAPVELENMKFNATAFTLGKSSTLITLNNNAANYTVGTTPTDAEKLAISVDRFVGPAASSEVTANLTLPTTAVFGTVAWTSSNPDVISITGVVTRPASGQPDELVRLSYVITVGAESSTPVEIELTVKAAEAIPVVTLYTASFGPTALSGYGEGMIFETNGTWSNILTTATAWNPTIHTVNKNRVQIGSSTNPPHDTKGGFLVFGPISTALVSYMEFDLSSYASAKKMEFEFATWSSTSLTNITGSAVTSAVLKLQRFESLSSSWIDEEGSSIDLKGESVISSTEYKTTAFTFTSTGKFRLVYSISGTGLVTTNTAYAITIDNLKITDR